jgi:hypothetical protein
MFEIYCPDCASRRIIFPSQIVTVANGADGVVVHFECWCGALRTWEPKPAVDRREPAAA